MGEIPENNCVQLKPISYEFPESLEQPPKIRIHLKLGDKMLSKNFYNLRYYDLIQTKKMGKLMKRSSDILMYGKSSRGVRLLKVGYYACRIVPYLIYLGIRTKIKWRRRKKELFEYEDVDFLRK